jgi:hypothetical protein
MSIVKTWRYQKTRFGNILVRTVTPEQMRKSWPRHDKSSSTYFCPRALSKMMGEVADENQFHFELKCKPLCCADAFVKPESLKTGWLL